MPHLITPRKQGSKRKSGEGQQDQQVVAPRKLSLLERRSAFLLHVVNARQLDEEIAKHVELLRQRSQTLQPFVAVVGPLTAPKDFYAVIGSMKYKCRDIIEAIETVFQSFFAFDLSYPSYVETIWLFFQKAVYDIDLPADKPNDSIKTLIAQIKSKIESHQARQGIGAQQEHREVIQEEAEAQAPAPLRDNQSYPAAA